MEKFDFLPNIVNLLYNDDYMVTYNVATILQNISNVYSEKGGDLFIKYDQNSFQEGV